MTLPCPYRVLLGMSFSLYLCGVLVEFCVLCVRETLCVSVWQCYNLAVCSSRVRVRTAAVSVCSGPELTQLALRITHTHTIHWHVCGGNV